MDSDVSSSSGTGGSGSFSNETGSARDVLLEEARTTVAQQLGQIDKLDATAVRTVRMTLVLLGILAGGSRLFPVPDLGLLGVLGTWSLVGSLLAGLLVYGTSQLFIGPSLDELTVEGDGKSLTERTYVELIGEYENGIRRNLKILHLNGFVLAVARVLFALAVVFVVLGFFRHVPEPPRTASAVRTFISQYYLF